MSRVFNSSVRYSNGNHETGDWAREFHERWARQAREKEEKKKEDLQEEVVKFANSKCDRIVIDELKHYISIGRADFLYFFSLYHCEGAFTFLKEKGFNINSIITYGETSLSSVIAHRGPTSIIEELLTLGANPNIVFKDRTALTTAAYQPKSEEVVKLLLKYGADSFYNYPEETYDLMLIQHHISSDEQLIKIVVDSCFAKKNPQICLEEIMEFPEIFGMSACPRYLKYFQQEPDTCPVNQLSGCDNYFQE